MLSKTAVLYSECETYMLIISTGEKDTLCWHSESSITLQLTGVKNANIIFHIEKL